MYKMKSESYLVYNNFFAELHPEIQITRHFET